VPDIDEIDDDIWFALRDSVTDLPSAQAPQLDTVVARGRAHRRRQRSRLAMSGGAVIVAIVLLVGVTWFTRTASTPPARVARGTAPRNVAPVHVRLAAFSVDTNPNGSVTVRVTPGQTMNPSTFRQILARAGVPAVIWIGSLCRTHDQPGDLRQVFPEPQPTPAFHSPQAPALVLRPGPASVFHVPGAHGRLRSVPAPQTMVIEPSAIPAHAELSVGYFSDHVEITLVTVGEHLNCTSNGGTPSKTP
jgi:hypothetical protein